MAYRNMPSRYDGFPLFLTKLKKVFEYATRAENARQSFVALCKENDHICDCWRRKRMGKWELSNERKRCAEDDNRIAGYPETPCPNCGKLLPAFDSEE